MFMVKQAEALWVKKETKPNVIPTFPFTFYAKMNIFGQSFYQ